MSRVQFYTDTAQIWDGMLADMEAATESIELEQYSMWDDASGRRFLDLLERKRKEGVQVRVVCDGYGSWPLFRSENVKKLIKQGLLIKSYNPLTPNKLSSFTYHLHRKILVIDGRVGWLGGIGIKLKFFGFKDSMVRFEDMDIVSDLEKSFDLLWTDLEHGEYFGNHDIQKRSEDPKLLVNYPGYGSKEIYEEMRAKISEAKKSIYLTTSYFFPDRNFFQMILAKAKSGVDVKIILRGKDDEFLPVRFSTSYFHKALAAGIGIYRYETAIIHAKTAVVDDAWATVGSSNLDKLSFYYNMEANVSSSDPEFVANIKQQFLDNVTHCRRINLEDWTRRPWAERALEILVWPLHKYL